MGVTPVGPAAGMPVWHPSANFGARRNGLRPELIVLHYTAMSGPLAALERLCDPRAEVSAHYLIAADGRIWQMVREADRAWHAGAGIWGGQGDVNSRSIGIELDNRGTHPFAEPQMMALEQLLAGIMARWSIGAAGVIGHSDMAPGRKIDPGARFDWARLARQGLARPAGQSQTPAMGQDLAAAFRTAARCAGYGDDLLRAEELDTVLEAVRLRYRPWATGPLSKADIAVLTDPDHQSAAATEPTDA